MFGVINGQEINGVSGAPEYIAVGFLATQFGTPNSPYPVTVTASAVAANTSFGVPAWATLCEASSIEPVAIIPQAFWAFDQYTQPDGFLNTARFGQAVVSNFVPFAPLAHQTAAAQSWQSGAFGTPSAPTNVTGLAAPLVPIDRIGIPQVILAYSFTRYGTPTARTTLAADTIGTNISLGTPSAVLSGRAASIQSTAFGEPLSASGRLASPVNRRAMFGVPRATKTRDHRAYGLNCGRRFGQPQAFNRINYPAQGLPPTVMFGTIQALQVHRARPMAPDSQFGDPLLLRSPTC